ncbi:hypothetical protein QHH11_16345 [Aphanizomenon sp. PH219]|nr:hypothetical protein [Aphanizomenon sp. 202]MDK2460687.1 hypothetical protein [Aphanizomenon sp. PH219]
MEKLDDYYQIQGEPSFHAPLYLQFCVIYQYWLAKGLIYGYSYEDVK